MPDNVNNPIIGKKSLIRSQIRTLRSSLSPHKRSMKSHALCTEVGRILGLEEGEREENTTIEARILADRKAASTPALRKGDAVALYSAFSDEANLDELINLCFRNEIRVALPCMNPKGSARPMDMRMVSRSAWHDGSIPFVQNPLRRIAHDDAAVASFPMAAPDALEAIIVPLVAFDEQRRRLGYGGGNYDAYLPLVSETCIVIGVAFAEQRVVRVPAENHDLALPVIVYA